MASPNLSEMVTTTLRNRSGKLTDNITRNNALLHRLREKGNIKLTSGGRTIVQELEYAENSGSMWYSGLTGFIRDLFAGACQQAPLAA